MIGVVLRADQPVLFGVPEGDYDRPARWRPRRDGPGDLQRRRHPRRVVGRPVADRVAARLVGARAAQVVVVGAHDHVLGGQLAARDHGDDVGPAGKGLRVGRIAGRRGVEPVRDRLQLIDDELAGQRRAGRVVVPAGGVVPGQPGQVVPGATRDDRAGGQCEETEDESTRAGGHCADPTRARRSLPQNRRRDDRADHCAGTRLGRGRLRGRARGRCATSLDRLVLGALRPRLGADLAREAPRGLKGLRGLGQEGPEEVEDVGVDRVEVEVGVDSLAARPVG